MKKILVASGMTIALMASAAMVLANENPQTPDAFASLHKVAEELKKKKSQTIFVSNVKRTIPSLPGTQIGLSVETIPVTQWDVNFTVYSKAYADAMGLPEEWVVKMPENVLLMNYRQYTHGSQTWCTFNITFDKRMGIDIADQIHANPNDPFMRPSWPENAESKKRSSGYTHLFKGEKIDASVKEYRKEFPFLLSYLATTDASYINGKATGKAAQMPLKYSAPNYHGYNADNVSLYMPCGFETAEVLSTKKASIWLRKKGAPEVNDNTRYDSQYYTVTPIPDKFAELITQYTMLAESAEGYRNLQKYNGGKK